MIQLRTHLAVLLVAALLAVCGSPARAHEFKLDAIINAFVTMEPDEAHLVVRVPIYLFKSAKFPNNEPRSTSRIPDAAIERALADLQQDVVLFEDGRRLTASKASGRLSLPSDKLFENYDEALRHVSEPVAPDTQIYIDQGYVDAHITYPLQAPNPEMSIRTTAAPEFGDALKLTVRYKPLEGGSRTLIMTSRSGTVALNPTWWRAAAASSDWAWSTS